MLWCIVYHGPDTKLRWVKLGLTTELMVIRIILSQLSQLRLWFDIFIACCMYLRPLTTLCCFAIIWIPVFDLIKLWWLIMIRSQNEALQEWLSLCIHMCLSLIFGKLVLQFHSLISYTQSFLSNRWSLTRFLWDFIFQWTSFMSGNLECFVTTLSIIQIVHLKYVVFQIQSFDLLHTFVSLCLNLNQANVGCSSNWHYALVWSLLILQNLLVVEREVKKKRSSRRN